MFLIPLAQDFPSSNWICSWKTRLGHRDSITYQQAQDQLRTLHNHRPVEGSSTICSAQPNE
jgi:hypothetical protein